MTILQFELRACGHATFMGTCPMVQYNYTLAPNPFEASFPAAVAAAGVCCEALTACVCLIEQSVRN